MGTNFFSNHSKEEKQQSAEEEKKNRKRERTIGRELEKEYLREIEEDEKWWKENEKEWLYLYGEFDRAKIKKKGEKKNLRNLLMDELIRMEHKMENYLSKEDLITDDLTKDYHINGDETIFMKTQSEFLEEYVSMLKIFGITNKKLAENWGIKPETLYKYINNIKKFDIEFICKISYTFCVDPKIWLRIESIKKKFENNKRLEQILCPFDYNQCTLENILKSKVKPS